MSAKTTVRRIAPRGGKKPAPAEPAAGPTDQQMLLIHARNINAHLEEVDSLVTVVTEALLRQDCNIERDAARTLGLAWERISQASHHAASIMAQLGDDSAQVQA